MAEDVRQAPAAQAAPPEKKPKRGLRLSKGGAEPGGKRSARRAGKRRKPLIIAAAALLLLAVLGAFVFVVIQFDQWGIRTSFIGAVDSLDPQYRALTRREAELAEKSGALDARELEAAEEDERLAVLRQELERREGELKVEAGSGETESSGYWLRLSPQDTEAMESLAKTYAAMDAAAAAEIMAGLYSVRDMAAILYHMAERSAAPILEAMDRQMAARVTQELLRN
jgi:flagellar motility protein MotE (MotC chaperone)